MRSVVERNVFMRRVPVQYVPGLYCLFGVNRPPSFSAEVIARVELCPYYPSLSLWEGMGFTLQEMHVKFYVFLTVHLDICVK
jgi:hypothetical protein